MPGLGIGISPMFSRIAGDGGNTPIPPPPYAIFSKYIITLLPYNFGDPSPESDPFSLLGLGLVPAADNITIIPDAEVEIYDPSDLTWKGTSFNVAYTGGAITLAGFKVRFKSTTPPGVYSVSVTVTAPNTVPFVLTVNGQVILVTEFVIKVKTDNPGTSSSTQFKLPLMVDEIYDALIDWGDGTTTNQTTDVSPTHTYPIAGTYTIKISGIFPAILFLGGEDCLKLTSIENWGNIVFLKFAGAFKGCQNMVASFPDYPNISNCTSLASSFENCNLFNGNLNGCDTSNILNAALCFYLCTNYNQPMNLWDMSSNISFFSMFEACTAFNQNISNWNTSSGINMTATFSGCVNFNQPLNWDVSNVTMFTNMFVLCSVFNQDISAWNTSSALSTQNMFLAASVFNGNIGGWNVSSVTNMSQMFFNAFGFNRDIGNWNISNVSIFSNFMFGKTAADYSVANLDSIYNKWSLLTVQPNISIDFNTIKYTVGGAAGKAILAGPPNNWTIVDGGI